MSGRLTKAQGTYREQCRCLGGESGARHHRGDFPANLKDDQMFTIRNRELEPGIKTRILETGKYLNAAIWIVSGKRLGTIWPGALAHLKKGQ